MPQEDAAAGRCEGAPGGSRDRVGAEHTTHLARLLEARAAVRGVHPRDDHKQSWRTIAKAIHGDPEKQFTVRRQYDAGRRHVEGG